MERTGSALFVLLALATFNLFTSVQGFGESATQVTNLTSIVEQCRKESNITQSDLKALRKPYPFPHKIRCYMKCYAEKNGLWKDGAPIDAAVIGVIKGDYYFHQDSANKLVARYNNCKSLVGVDECDTVGLIYECLYPQQPPLEPIKD